MKDSRKILWGLYPKGSFISSLYLSNAIIFHLYPSITTSLIQEHQFEYKYRNAKKLMAIQIIQIINIVQI
jgi:hypothetical protein